jgi:hypothetical protein
VADFPVGSRVPGGSQKLVVVKAGVDQAENLPHQTHKAFVCLAIFREKINDFSILC